MNSLRTIKVQVVYDGQVTDLPVDFSVVTASEDKMLVFCEFNFGQAELPPWIASSRFSVGIETYGKKSTCISVNRNPFSIPVTATFVARFLNSVCSEIKLNAISPG